MIASTSLRVRLPQLLASLSIALTLPAAAREPEGCPAGMIAVDGGELDAPGRPRARIRPFCLDRTEVTVEAYAACAKVGACAAAELECGNAATWGKKGLGSHPVNCVTWEEADTFCREHGKRLPSEHEWEWAARGGERALSFPWGEEAPADRACWDGDGNSLGLGKRKATCAVGANTKGRSADGIQDLAGNVREWTSTEQDRHRVIRGGSWGDSLPEFLAVTFRGWNAPDERIELVGFRCAAPRGTVARRPAPRVAPPKKAAAMDDSGVLVFESAVELNGSARRKR
jgi:formylglycine-generating enzyme required for sulfatase activity